MEGRKQRRPRDFRRGATLVELVCVVAILIVLFALIATVLVGSKRKALRTSEMTRLHQLSIAGAMYRDQCGEWPLSTIQLRTFSPNVLVDSPLDETDGGMANELVTSIKADCPACDVRASSFRRTFIGPGDYGLTTRQFRDEIAPYPNAGWLVSLTASNPLRPTIAQDQFKNPTGSYLRLLTSGGILPRSHQPLVRSVGNVYAIQFMFADGDDAWRNRVAGMP